MKKHYSFLRDELAVTEIRKHQWIESEKKGRPIGFATSAMDWIQQYGKDWKLHRLGYKNRQHHLIERRQHRRFAYALPVDIKIDDTTLSVQTEDISLIGMACQLPRSFPLHSKTTVSILFKKNERVLPRSKFNFESRILRVSSPQGTNGSTRYEVFIPFSEEVRDFIRSNATSFKS